MLGLDPAVTTDRWFSGSWLRTRKGREEPIMSGDVLAAELTVPGPETGSGWGLQRQTAQRGARNGPYVVLLRGWGVTSAHDGSYST